MADGLGQGEVSDGLDGAQWEGDQEAVVEVPVAEGPAGLEEGLKGSSDGAARGESGGSVEGGDVEEGREQRSDGSEAGSGGADGSDESGNGDAAVKANPDEVAEQESGEESGAGESENGAGSGASGGGEERAEEIPLVVETGAGRNAGVRGDEGGDRKVGNGGAPTGKGEVGAGMQEAGGAEAVAPVAVEPVVEEVRSGLGRIEGKLGVLVKLVESQTARSRVKEEEGGEDVLAEIKGDIGMQRDLLGSTLKQVETVTGRVEEKVDAA